VFGYRFKPKPLFAGLRLTFYVNHKRLPHLMAIFALFRIQRGYSRFVRFVEAFSLYETVTKKFDVVWCWRMQQSDANKADPSGNIDWYQNRRQKVVNRGVLRSCRGDLTFKFDKNPLTYSASYINLVGLELCLGVAKPSKAPVPTGLIDIKQQSATTSCSTQIATFSW